jgi:hypothetical protein
MVAGKLERTMSCIDELPEEQVEQLKELALGKEIVSHEQAPTKGKAIIITEDDKLNYSFGSRGSEVDLDYPEHILREKVDYNFITQEEAEKELNSDTKPITEETADKRNSLSYMSVNSVEDGVEWYRKNFPKVPDDLLPLMARWSFGDLSEVTKKSVKNDVKRVKQGKKPKNKGLEVKKGPIVVTF